MTVGVILACSALLAGVTLVHGQGTEPAASSAVTTGARANWAIGMTLPSQRSQLAFHTMGIVDKVMVKEGDTVKTGQVLMKLDDRAELATLAGLEVDARSQSAIKAAEIEQATKKLIHGRVERMHQEKVATDEEFEQSKLEVELSGIKVDQAKEDLLRKIAERDRQKILVDAMVLKAMFDGQIEKLDMHVGEVVEGQKPAATVVQNDPLWVEVTLPSSKAKALEGVSSLKVQYDDDRKSRDAKLIFLSPVVDAASDWRLVRLEMPNPEHKPSGLRVMVELPAR